MDSNKKVITIQLVCALFVGLFTGILTVFGQKVPARFAEFLGKLGGGLANTSILYSISWKGEIFIDSTLYRNACSLRNFILLGRISCKQSFLFIWRLLFLYLACLCCRGRHHFRSRCFFAKRPEI